MAGKVRQTEEERRAMEAMVSRQFQELEVKISDIHKPTQVVSNLMKYYEKSTCKIFRRYVVTYNTTYRRRRKLKRKKL